MIITWRLVIIVAILSALTGAYGMKHHGDNVINRNAAKAARDYQKLQTALNASDLQLLNAQSKDSKTRDVLVTKTEVIYRDKIKNPDTVRCIVDSGLLNLYDATLSTSSK